MRLIDADALYKLFMVNPKGERIPEVDCDNFPVRVDIHDVKKAILKSPTIDAVPVVRCKDCKHWTTSRHGGNCDLLMIGAIDEMEFCSAGAKMDGEK